MNHTTNSEEENLYVDLEQDVIDTYKKIIASRYFTTSHLEQVATEAKQRIGQHSNTKPPTFFLAYMKGVFSLSISCSTYEEYERRFHHFFSSMADAVTQSLEDYKEDLEFYRFFLEKVLFHFVYDMHESRAPWSMLLNRIVTEMPVRHLEPVYQFLTNTMTTKHPTREVSLTYSLIALLVGKEQEALELITINALPVTANEITVHFQCLKKRERWETMQKWLTVLFPYKPNGPYGSLQPFADEMQASLHRNPIELTQIWNRWLLAPSFHRYESLTRHLNDDETEAILDELLPKMQERFHQVETVSTYMKLLLKYERYKEAARYFFQHERDPLRLRQEKVDVLNALYKEHPHLVKPIYHQFVVRLVEKKSRAHYEQAVVYIKLLQKLYESSGELALFQDYVKKMKKTYRTYRAFVEELKTIER